MPYWRMRRLCPRCKKIRKAKYIDGGDFLSSLKALSHRASDRPFSGITPTKFPVPLRKLGSQEIFLRRLYRKRFPIWKRHGPKKLSVEDFTTTHYFFEMAL